MGLVDTNMDDLNTLYRQELNYYKSVLELAHQLERAAADGNIQDLESLFAEREKRLAEILAHQEERRILSEKGNKLNTNQKQSLAEIIEEIRKTMEEVMKIDQKVEEGLKSKKDDIQDKLARIRQGRKALKGYAPRRFLPRYMDKKG